jgi:hypothetical protein
MLLGSLMSLLAGAWKFMTQQAEPVMEPALNRLYGIADQVEQARCEADLAKAEQEIDDILKAQLAKYAPGEVDPGEAAALSLATHRLERQMERRRRALDTGPSPS